MRLLVYADLQATDGSDLCYTQPDTPLQHYRIERFYRDLVRVYKEHKCDGVVDLGDTTDDRSSLPVPTLDVLCAGLAQLPNETNYAYNYKLIGNHEQFMRDTTISVWRLFAPYFNVTQDREILTVNGCKLFFCSYPADHKELAAWIAAESSKHRGRKILFGHFQVKGAKLNNTEAATGIPKDALTGFDLVLLGHIHQPQSLTDRIHYVGSPFEQDWGERGQAKRLAIVDTKDFSVEWVPLLGYPEYREVTLKQFQALTSTLDEHRYRVNLTSHEEAEQFFAHPAFSRGLGVYNYDTQSVEQVEEKDWSFDGVLRRYLELVPAEGVDLPADELLAMGKLLADI